MAAINSTAGCLSPTAGTEEATDSSDSELRSVIMMMMMMMMMIIVLKQ